MLLSNASLEITRARMIRIIRVILVRRAHVVLTKRYVGSGNEIVIRILQVIVATCLSKIAGFLRY